MSFGASTVESLDGLKRVLEGDLKTFAGGGSVVGGWWARICGTWAWILGGCGVYGQGVVAKRGG